MRIDLVAFLKQHEFTDNHAIVRFEKLMKSLLHPDKNLHINAKDAFQKMYNSLSKWKSKRRSLSSCLLLNLQTIPAMTACAA
jgi:hypothetical protein